MTYLISQVIYQVAQISFFVFILLSIAAVLFPDIRKGIGKFIIISMITFFVFLVISLILAFPV